METKGFRGALLSVGLVAGMAASSFADAASVTFSDIMDAVPDDFFDSASTHPDPGDPNKLIIGLDDFTASSSGVFAAVDTITFIITAEPGFFLKTVTYTESGTGATVGSAVAVSTGSWTVGGTPSVFPAALFVPGSAGPWGFPGISVDLSGLSLTSVPVSITNSLFAFSAGGTATISKTAAFVTAELTAIPLPPAALLLGSALLATMIIGAGRRSKS